MGSNSNPAVCGSKVPQYATYDSLQRLKLFDRGNLTGTPLTGITGTPAKERDWELDQLGNWANLLDKTSGTTDLDQDRAHNSVNEIDDDNTHADGCKSQLKSAAPGGRKV